MVMNGPSTGQLLQFFRKREASTAVYKSGTGTRGRGLRDACVGTWDLGTRDEGLEDIKCGTRGRMGRGRGDVWDGDAGTSNTGTQRTRDVNNYCKSRR